jgi:hypothetical protein
MNGNLILILPIAIVALCAWLIFRGFKRDTERKGVIARAVEWVRTRAAGGPGEPRP